MMGNTNTCSLSLCCTKHSSLMLVSALSPFLLLAYFFCMQIFRIMNQKLSPCLKKSPADINCVYPDLACCVKTWKVAGSALRVQTRNSECFKTDSNSPALQRAADKPIHEMSTLSEQKYFLKPPVWFCSLIINVCACHQIWPGNMNLGEISPLPQTDSPIAVFMNFWIHWWPTSRVDVIFGSSLQGLPLHKTGETPMFSGTELELPQMGLSNSRDPSCSTKKSQLP